MYEIYQRLLDEKGLKNSDVSRATGISNMTLSDWKRGVSKPKDDKVKKIAEFLGVTYGYLMGWEDEEIMVEAIKDNILSGMSERVKEYAIRLAQLSETELGERNNGGCYQKSACLCGRFYIPLQLATRPQNHSFLNERRWNFADGTCEE